MWILANGSPTLLLGIHPMRTGSDRQFYYVSEFEEKFEILKA
jgi:hypothetical protein